MNETYKKYIPVFLAVSIFALGSCKSVAHIPDNLKFDAKKHSHIRTMRLHMLRIKSVNNIKIENNSTYDVQTIPGVKHVTVLYSGGTAPLPLSGRPGVYNGSGVYYTYKQQKGGIVFTALPGRSHFIQYIAHPDRPMTVWQNSHDYISHLREKPLMDKELKPHAYSGKYVTAVRVVRGSYETVRQRFLNELLLQQYLGDFIQGWAISYMFYPSGKKIIVNLPGIGEKELDNEVMGHYEFYRLAGNRVKIVMRYRGHMHQRYPNFMIQVFSRFDPSYRVERMKK